MKVKDLIVELLEVGMNTDVEVKVGDQYFEVWSMNPPSYRNSHRLSLEIDADKATIAEAIGASFEE